VVLGQLAAVARRQDCAVVLVLHLNKAPSKDAYLRISSSTGFYNAARSVVLVVPDPEEPEGHRLVAQVKANWSRRSPVQRHVLEEIVLPEIDPDTGRNVVTSRMRFLGTAEGIDRDTLLGAERGERSGERMDEAVGWLRDVLADGEWHPSKDVKAAAEREGIAERTLKRAAGDLEVEYESRGFPAVMFWRLPQLGQPLSTNRGPTVEPASANALPLAYVPVGPDGPDASGTGNGPTAEAEDGTAEAVECIVCSETFVEGANGTGLLTCAACAAKRGRAT
jgi:hypothetical protein